MLALLASCGVRPPTPIDVAAIVRAKGAAEARLDLEIRVIANPRDVQARLALAAIADDAGRPSEAIEQLEEVERLGGLLGIRWHDVDRARLARLLHARGLARLARGSTTALADLERAHALGAAIGDRERTDAAAAFAIGKLRHVDAGERAVGRRKLAELATDPAWRGAAEQASPDEHGAFGKWLWARGARREAYDQLAAWHASSTLPREPTLQAAYLQAVAWWTPLDAAPPPKTDLVGGERCLFASACRASDAVVDRTAATAWLAAPLGAPTRDADEAAAAIAVALRGWLRGDGGWTALIAAHVDIAAARTTLPAELRPIAARAAGGHSAVPAHVAARYATIAAAERALDGASFSEVRATLGDAATSDDGRALLALVDGTAPPFGGAAGRGVDAPQTIAPHVDDDPVATAAARYAFARVPGGAALGALVAAARAFHRDPDIAERLGRDIVATAVDGAGAHAALGALFDALADSARARHEWQAAVDASWEPSFARGLAETIARAGDAPAAVVVATGAAAADGDPARVWIALSRALESAGKPVEALAAARDAIDLAGLDQIAAALDAAIAASRDLGRDSQVAALAQRRAKLSPPPPLAGANDPSDAAAAIAAAKRAPDAGALARLWVASRWQPRDVETRGLLAAAVSSDDARRATVVAELTELAGDREDLERAFAAVTALRIAFER